MQRNVQQVLSEAEDAIFRNTAMKASRLFSVVVASYNYENLVVEALKSLLAQTFRDFEIVVVDDGSSDGSVANIRRFIEQNCAADVPIRLVTHPGGANKGLPFTVKLGIDESRGKYVAFCEADDLWSADHLKEVAKEIADAKSKAVVIVNDVDIFGDAERVAKFSRFRAYRRKRLKAGFNLFSPADFREMNYILTFSAACVRRDVLASCDFHPVGREVLLDWWIWRQILYNRPLYYIDRKLTKWRMHASFMTSANAAVGNSDEMKRRVDEFFSAGDALLRRQHPISALWRLRSKSVTRPGMVKRIRGTLKRLTPYCIQSAHAYRSYGIRYPKFGVLWSILPFGLVCYAKGLDPDKGTRKALYEADSAVGARR